MDVADYQERLNQGFEVAKVQVWLVKPSQVLNDQEVLKAGCKTVAEYIGMLEKEGLKSMGKRIRGGYTDLPLVSFGKIEGGQKSLFAVMNEVPDNLKVTYQGIE